MMIANKTSGVEPQPTLFWGEKTEVKEDSEK